MTVAVMIALFVWGCRTEVVKEKHYTWLVVLILICGAMSINMAMNRAKHLGLILELDFVLALQAMLYTSALFSLALFGGVWIGNAVRLRRKINNAGRDVEE